MSTMLSGLDSFSAKLSGSIVVAPGSSQKNFCELATDASTKLETVASALTPTPSGTATPLSACVPPPASVLPPQVRNDPDGTVVTIALPSAYTLKAVTTSVVAVLVADTMELG